MTTEQQYLRRSQDIPELGRLMLVIYLILAVILLPFVGACLFSEPTAGTINGFASGVSAIDYSADGNEVEYQGWFGKGFIGFKRLVPVPDHIEAEIKLAQETSRYEPARLISYSPVFNEDSLASRLEDYLSVWVGPSSFYVIQFEDKQFSYTITHDEEL